MIQAQYAILADECITDANGRVTISGVFDQIFAQALPAKHPQMTFVVMLFVNTQKDLGTHRLSLKVSGPGGTPLVEQELKVDIRAMPAGTSPWLSAFRIPFVLENVPLHEYGKHLVALSSAKQRIAEQHFMVAPLSSRPSV